MTQQFLFAFNRFVRSSLLLIICLGAVFTAGCQKTMEPLNLQNPNLPSSPNFAFAAPGKYRLQADMVSPIWEQDAKSLAHKTVDYIKGQPRITTIKENWDDMHFVFIQKTAVLRFPDQIEVQVVSLDDKQSSLLMLSRAQYGYYDFGVNQRRVHRWLQELKTSTVK